MGSCGQTGAGSESRVVGRVQHAVLRWQETRSLPRFRISGLRPWNRRVAHALQEPMHHLRRTSPTDCPEAIALWTFPKEVSLVEAESLFPTPVTQVGTRRKEKHPEAGCWVGKVAPAGIEPTT